MYSGSIFVFIYIALTATIVENSRETIILISIYYNHNEKIHQNGVEGTEPTTTQITKFIRSDW